MSALAIDADFEEPYVPLPLPLPALAGRAVVSICAGSAHSFAITADGAAYGWGLASHGRLGVGREEDLPEDDDGDVYVEAPTRLHGLPNGCSGSSSLQSSRYSASWFSTASRSTHTSSVTM